MRVGPHGCSEAPALRTAELTPAADLARGREQQRMGRRPARARPLCLSVPPLRSPVTGHRPPPRQVPPAAAPTCPARSAPQPRASPRATSTAAIAAASAPPHWLPPLSLRPPTPPARRLKANEREQAVRDLLRAQKPMRGRLRRGCEEEGAAAEEAWLWDEGKQAWLAWLAGGSGGSGGPSAHTER